MSGRQVFLSSSVPLSKRFAKLEKGQQRSGGGGGGGGGAKKVGVKASAIASAPGRKRQDKARQTASKSRELAAASKRGLGGAPVKAAKAVKQQEKKTKNAAAAAGGAGRAAGAGGKGKKGEGKVARLTGKKVPGVVKTKKPGKGKDSFRKADAKVLSKDDLEYELDRYRHEAGRGPNPDAARLDAELEAYRSAKAAAAAAAAAPAAGMDADAAGTA